MLYACDSELVICFLILMKTYIYIYIYIYAGNFWVWVAKVLDSGHPEFKAGDFVWEIIGWEEYNLITKTTDTLIKIQHTDVPLSYYTGIHGKIYCQ